MKCACLLLAALSASLAAARSTKEFQPASRNLQYNPDLDCYYPKSAKAKSEKSKSSKSSKETGMDFPTYAPTAFPIGASNDAQWTVTGDMLLNIVDDADPILINEIEAGLAEAAVKSCPVVDCIIFADVTEIDGVPVNRRRRLAAKTLEIVYTITQKVRGFGGKDEDLAGPLAATQTDLANVQAALETVVSVPVLVQSNAVDANPPQPAPSPTPPAPTPPAPTPPAPTPPSPTPPAPTPPAPTPPAPTPPAGLPTYSPTSFPTGPTYSPTNFPVKPVTPATAAIEDASYTHTHAHTHYHGEEDDHSHSHDDHRE